MARKTQTRGKREGTIYLDSERGLFVAEIEIDGRRIRAKGKDRTAARASLNRLVRQHDDGTLSTDRSLTVEHAVRRFLDRAVPNRQGGNLAPSTREIHAWAGALIVAGIGKRKLSTLTVQNVEDFLDSLAVTKSPRQSGSKSTRRPVQTGKPLSKSSVKKVRSTLSMALDEAVRRREVATNVARFAHLPVDAARPTPRVSLTPDQARALLVALRSEPNGAMFGLMLRIGLRPGEAAGLLWSSLDGTMLTVSRARQLERGRVRIVDELKTAAARRTIDLADDLVAWLGEHRRAQATARLASLDWHDPALMFASSTGRVLDPRHGRQQLLAVCARAGVPGVTPNELRHSCASLLADEGVRNEDIADLLGHTTTAMVDQTYRHRLRSSIDVARNASWPSAADA